MATLLRHVTLKMSFVGHVAMKKGKDISAVFQSAKIVQAIKISIVQQKVIAQRFLFEKVVQKLKVQKKLSVNQAKKQLLEQCETEGKWRSKGLSSQLCKTDNALTSLERQITTQKNNNEKEKELNESLKKLIAENEEILRERRKLLKILKKQHDERKFVEQEIAKYGGNPMNQDDLGINEEFLMTPTDFSEAEEELANDIETGY